MFKACFSYLRPCFENFEVIKSLVVLKTKSKNIVQSSSHCLIQYPDMKESCKSKALAIWVSANCGSLPEAHLTSRNLGLLFMQFEDKYKLSQVFFLKKVHLYHMPGMGWVLSIR